MGPENKFCADCEAKGPRWVSWNLGIFLCIRCSGIHSQNDKQLSNKIRVNLDTWTPEQIVNVCKRGNQWAKEYYEAKLPKDYQKPTTDSSLQYFMRDKYEHKKYITPTPPPFKSLEGLYENSSSEPAKKAKSKTNVSINPKKVEATKVTPVARPMGSTQTAVVNKPAVVSQPKLTSIDDLLGMDTPVEAAVPAAVSSAKKDASSPLSADLDFDIFQSAPPAATGGGNPSEASPFQTNDDATAAATNNSGGNKLMSKDSILSLYSQTPTVPVAVANSFQNPNTQFGGMQGQQMMTAPQQTMAAPNFSSTNPYYNQQTAQLQRGMYPNNVQQQQQQFPNQMAQMQWSQQQQGIRQQQQQQPQQLHMQMHQMNINNQMQPQQQQQQTGFNMQQYQGYTAQPSRNPFPMNNIGGSGGFNMQQQQRNFAAATPATGWNNGVGGTAANNGQTFSNHLWK